MGGGGAQQLSIKGDARVVVVTAAITSVAVGLLVTMSVRMATLRRTGTSLAGCCLRLLTFPDISLLLGVDLGVVGSLQVGRRLVNGVGLLRDEGPQLVIVLDGEIVAIDGGHLRKDGHVLGSQGGAIGA